MDDRFLRTEILTGKKALERLKNSYVAVFGIGGVGGYAAETLARSGIGRFDLIDNDRIDITNINRQIIADSETTGRLKTEVMAERIKKINPDAEVNVYNMFFLPENSDCFDFTKYSYIADCVDTVTAKIELVLKAQTAGTKIISSMGTGNKLDPSRFEIADIYKTSVCPLAKVMRRELKKEELKSLRLFIQRKNP